MSGSDDKEFAKDAATINAEIDLEKYHAVESGSRQDISSTYAAENASAQEKKIEAEKERTAQLLEIIFNSVQEIDSALERINEALKLAREAFEKCKAYKTAYEQGDLNQLLVLLDKDGQDISDLNTPQEILEAGNRQYQKHASEVEKNTNYVKNTGRDILGSEVSLERQKEQALNNIQDAKDIENNMNALGKLHKPTTGRVSDFQKTHSDLTELEIDNASRTSFASQRTNNALSSKEITDSFNKAAQAVLQENMANELTPSAPSLKL